MSIGFPGFRPPPPPPPAGGPGGPGRPPMGPPPPGGPGFGPPPPMGPPPGGPGMAPPPMGGQAAQQRQFADARFGPGAGDAFKQALDTLRPGQDARFGDAATKLQNAIQGGDLGSLQAAAQALEGLVKDKIANPQQAGGIHNAIAVLKQKIGALLAAGQGDSFSAGGAQPSWAKFGG